MNTIYVLTKTEPRAHTVDTCVLLASYDRADLEELVLSLWQEKEYVALHDMIDFWDGTHIEECVRGAVREARWYANSLTIVKIPII